MTSALSLNTVTVKENGPGAMVAGAARGTASPASRPGVTCCRRWGCRRRRSRSATLASPSPASAGGGMFPAPDAAGRAAAIEDNRRAIAEAHALGAQCLVMVCGGLPPGSRDLPGARATVRDGLAAILPEARDAGVTIALEPLHLMTCADCACALDARPSARSLRRARCRHRRRGRCLSRGSGTRMSRTRWRVPALVSPASTPA